MWTSALLIYFLALLTKSSSVFIKCCPYGYAFSDHLRCVMSINGDSDTILERLAFGNETEFVQNCYRSGDGVNDLHNDESKYGGNITKVENCTDVDNHNGTIHTMPCPIDWREKSGRCDSIFKPLIFWGATIVVFANLVYMFPYIIVVMFFCAISDLRNRAYDKAVLCHNASQLVIALILVGIGYFSLCHTPIKPIWLYIMLGLSLQFLSTTATFWLTVICIDMTLVITRFRWIPGSDVTGSEDKRKFRTYSAFAWGGGAIITGITCFMELCPWIPMSSLLKPNFERFDDGANYTVIFYVAVVPVISLLLNNALFVYTTYKVIKIRKSTAVVNENNSNVKKKYFTFLRLYLLMDTPWIVVVMGAVYPDLWILKFCRMLQPILMLLAILPKKKIYRVIKCSKVPVTNTIKLRIKNNGDETRC